MALEGREGGGRSTVPSTRVTGLGTFSHHYAESCLMGTNRVPSKSGSSSSSTYNTGASVLARQTTSTWSPPINTCATSRSSAADVGNRPLGLRGEEYRSTTDPSASKASKWSSCQHDESVDGYDLEQVARVVVEVEVEVVVVVVVATLARAHQHSLLLALGSLPTTTIGRGSPPIFLLWRILNMFTIASVVLIMTNA